MSITFNADEIFEMAIEIEKNGADFYKQAAAKTSDEDVKKMLLEFSDMEKGHQETFEQMRTDLSEADKETNVFDPDDETAMYLQTMADAHGWEGKKNPNQELTGSESMEEIIRIALRAEKNSVAFYVGIKDVVPSQNGKDQVQNVIREEMKHITSLNKRLVAL